MLVIGLSELSVRDVQLQGLKASNKQIRNHKGECLQSLSFSDSACGRPEAGVDPVCRDREEQGLCVVLAVGMVQHVPESHR